MVTRVIGPSSIIPPPVVLNVAPVWGTPSPTFPAGVGGSYALPVTDADGDPMTAAVGPTSAAFPAWLSVAGTPPRVIASSAAVAGTFAGLKVQVDDGNGHAVESLAFSVVVSAVANVAPVWGTPSPTFVTGVGGLYSLPVTDADGDAMTATVGPTSAAFPSWLTVLSSPPRLQATAPPLGTVSSLKVRVDDGHGHLVESAAFSCVVSAVPVFPGTMDDFALEGIFYPGAWTDPQHGGAVSLSLAGKHQHWEGCPAAEGGDDKMYLYGGDGYYGPYNLASTGSNRIHRMALDTAGAVLSHEAPYPYFGKAGLKFPVTPDVCPFIWDGSRHCFWIVPGQHGGNPINTPYEIGIPTDPYDLSPGTPVDQLRNEIIKFFPFELDAGTPGRYEFTGIATVDGTQPGENMSGCRVGSGPAADHIFWFTQNGSEAGVMQWFSCANPASQGSFTCGYSPSNTPFSSMPGVNHFTDPNDRIDQRPIIWDSATNEIIFTVYKAGWAGVFAIDMSNFPADTTTRKIYQGFEAGTTGGAQSPMAKRGRKLIIWGYPFGSTGTAAGSQGSSGMGFIEIDLDTGERRDAAQPYFMTYDSQRAPTNSWPVHGYNEGNYWPGKDKLLATPQLSTAGSSLVPFFSRPAVFGWTSPTWTPAAGTLKKITTDISGAPVNRPVDTFPAWASGPWCPPGHGGGPSPTAFSGGAYARLMSTNGCLIIHGGGNGDWWGNEIYPFDFDTRRWFRISDPSSALTGANGVDFGPGLDPTLPTNNAKYFNIAECEHGPLVAEFGACSFGDWGILPAGTQPGASHIYSGLQWIPGSMIGNKRGAVVDVLKSIVYTTRSSGRAHYFDCDRLNAPFFGGQQWGRLSKNKAAPHIIPPVTSVDLQAKRILHNSGYLDLDPASPTCNQHVSKAWDSSFGTPPPGPSSSGVGSAFDTSRRLWVATGSHSGSDPLWCRFVDGAGEIQFTPSFTGDPLWVNLVSGIGIEYVPAPVDAFFVYAPEDDPQKMWKLSLPTNPKTQAWTVSRITMTGATVDDYLSGLRVWSRLRWIPPLESLAFFHNLYVYLYKPAGVAS